MKVDIAKKTVKRVDLKCVEWDSWKIKMTETDYEGMMDCAARGSDKKTKVSTPTISPRSLAVDSKSSADLGEKPQYSKEKSTALNSPAPTTKNSIQTASTPLTHSVSVNIPKPPSKIICTDNKSPNYNKKTSKLDSKPNREQESHVVVQHLLPCYENISPTSSAESSPNIDTAKTNAVLGENVPRPSLKTTDVNQLMLDSEPTYLVVNSNSKNPDPDVPSHLVLDFNSVPNVDTNTNLVLKTKALLIGNLTDNNNTSTLSSKTLNFETDANETYKDSELSVNSISQLSAVPKTNMPMFKTAKVNNLDPLVKTNLNKGPHVKLDLKKKTCPESNLLNLLPIVIKRSQLKRSMNSVLDTQIYSSQQNKNNKKTNPKTPLESSSKVNIETVLRHNYNDEAQNNCRSNSKSITNTNQTPNTNCLLKTGSMANENLNSENTKEISDLNNNLNMPYEKTVIKINSVAITETNPKTNLESSTKSNIETNPKQKDYKDLHTNSKSNSKSITVTELHVDSISEKNTCINEESNIRENSETNANPNLKSNPNSISITELHVDSVSKQNTCINEESNIRENSEPNVNPDATSMLGQDVELLKTDNNKELNVVAQMPDLLSTRPMKRKINKQQRSRVSTSNIINSEGDESMLRLRCVGCGGTGELQCVPGHKSLYCIKRCYPKFYRIVADSFTAADTFHQNKDKAPSKRSKKCCHRKNTPAKRMCSDRENRQSNRAVPAKSIDEFDVSPRQRRKSNVISPLESDDNGTPSNQTISGRSSKETDVSAYKRQHAAFFGHLENSHDKHAKQVNDVPSVMMQRKTPIINNTMNGCHGMLGTCVVSSMIHENSQAAMQTNMSAHSKDIRQWNHSEVQRFVMIETGRPDLVRAFRDENIDGRDLCSLTDEHMIKVFKVKVGPAVSFIKRVKQMSML